MIKFSKTLSAYHIVVVSLCLLIIPIAVINRQQLREMACCYTGNVEEAACRMCMLIPKPKDVLVGCNKAQAQRVINLHHSPSPLQHAPYLLEIDN